MQAELIFRLINRHSGVGRLKKSYIAIDHGTQRLIMCFSAAMVRALRDHSRFLPVSKEMQAVAPSLYQVLTNTCAEPLGSGKEGAYGDFVLPKGKNSDFFVASNIPVLVALIVYSFFEERKYLENLGLLLESATKTSKEKDKGKGEAAPAGGAGGSEAKKPHKGDWFEQQCYKNWDTVKTNNNQTGEITCGDDHQDEGGTISVASDIRTHFLQMAKESEWKKGKSRDEFQNAIPGDYFKLTGEAKKAEWKILARCNIAWSEPGQHAGHGLDVSGDYRFSLCGGDVKECGVTIDRAFHVISTGGFLNPREERVFRRANPDVDLTNQEQVDNLRAEGPNTGKAALLARIKGSRAFWRKLETGNLFKSLDPKAPGVASERVIAERLWAIMNYSFDHEAHWKQVETMEKRAKAKRDGKEDPESDVEQQEQPSSVAGEFPPAEQKAGGKGVLEAKDVALTEEVRSVRACLHRALYNVSVKALSVKGKGPKMQLDYDLKQHWGNNYIHYGDSTYNSEGPLLRSLADMSVHMRTAQFESLIETKLDNLIKGDKQKLRTFLTSDPMQVDEDAESDDTDSDDDDSDSHQPGSGGTKKIKGPLYCFDLESTKNRLVYLRFFV